MKKLTAIFLSLILLFSSLTFVIAQEDTDIGSETESKVFAGFARFKYSNGSTHSTTALKFIGFNSASPQSTQDLLVTDDLDSYGAVIIGDIVYAFAHPYSEEYDDIGNDRLYRITTTDNWSATPIGNGYDYLNVVSMTYAEETDTIYALVNNEEDIHDHLMIVDRNNGTLSEVIDLSALSVRIRPSITYIGNGRFFAIQYVSGNGIIFDLSGHILEVLDNVINTTFEAVEAMYYDADDDVIYATISQHLYNGISGRLYCIDPETAQFTDMGIIGQGLGYSMKSIFPIDMEITVPSTPSQEEFDAAINADGSELMFQNDKATPWVIVEDGGRSYIQSAIQDQHNSSTSVTATFNNLTAGQVLSFDWGVSSENNYDWLSFYSNGTRIQRISGTQSFTRYTYTIPSNGNYVFKWTYSKDSSVSNGYDCGFIDNVSLTGNQPEPVPSEELINEALNVSGGTLEFIDDPVNPWQIDTSENGRMSIFSTVHGSTQNQAVCLRIRDSHAGDAIRFDWKSTGDFEVDRLFFRINSTIIDTLTGDNPWESFIYIVPEDGDYVFTWSYSEAVGDDAVGSDSNLSSNGCGWVDNVEYIREYGDPFAPAPNTPDQEAFDAAVNAVGENRTFKNDLVNPWQIANIDGRNCVVSDIAGMARTDSSFTINMGYLEAGSTISFDWKADSQEVYDALSVTLNGSPRREISGQTDWTTQTITIESSGYYTIGWRYSKDYITDSYSDRVWVDNVKITPVYTLEYHTATFVDGYDDSVIMTINVPDGYFVNYPDRAPVHPGYEFIGWQGQSVDITSDVIITAVYIPRGTEPPTGLLGDVNGDGLVNITDATAVLRHVMHLHLIPGDYLANADVNGDGVINTADATLIIRIAMNLY